jgi:hypothetical protein
MQRGKNTQGEKTHGTSLKVVEVKTDQVQIEREIERNIKKIRSLISKLRPMDRQKYFDGLLSHILDEPVAWTAQTGAKPSKTNVEKDYSKLSFEELILIEELSVKMEQLYRTIDHDPS